LPFHLHSEPRIHLLSYRVLHLDNSECDWSYIFGKGNTSTSSRYSKISHRHPGDTLCDRHQYGCGILSDFSVSRSSRICCRSSDGDGTLCSSRIQHHINVIRMDGNGPYYVYNVSTSGYCSGWKLFEIPEGNVKEGLEKSRQISDYCSHKPIYGVISGMRFLCHLRAKWKRSCNG
ncbi:hypothetical protein PENTCL1PPCAC_22110, partial [Pristionchus entomophagus]